ncbi:Ribosome production factor 1 [Armadillidium vulgare]|nr:Ribosome production factor 1 [Armadillidium vulgare]
MDPNFEDENSKEEHMDSGEEEKEDEIQMPLENKLNNIKNKMRRQVAYQKHKQEKRKAKLELKKLKKKEERLYGKKESVIHTIESKREEDETIMDNEDKDLIAEEATDQYADYYTKKYVPKIFITSSSLIHGRTITFMRELGKLIPNSVVLWRKKASLKKKIEVATAQGFTDMIVINEDNRRPDGFLVIHLLGGPTALFRLSSVMTCKLLKRNSREELLGHRPELILNNFKTRLGRSIGRMFGALFHYDPEFKGRSVVTFHNQRDYIFFRHHRYQFKNTKKVNLKELGPRFTLKLEWLREGVFEGDFEWVLKRKEMESSRLRFHL